MKGKGKRGRWSYLTKGQRKRGGGARVRGRRGANEGEEGKVELC